MTRKILTSSAREWRDSCLSSWQSHAMSTNFPNLPAAVEAYISRDHVALDLAKRLGVAEASVSRWRNGGEPDVKRIQALAKELGVTVAYLAGDTEAAQNQRELALLVAYRKADTRDRTVVDALLLPDDALTQVNPEP